MQFEPTGLAGAWLVRLDPMRDSRGFFARTFCAKEFGAHGLETEYPQHSISCSAVKGTLRGMHFQRAPHGEVKLVRCLSGAIWDVIVDLRPDRRHFADGAASSCRPRTRISSTSLKGFAHGFQTLSDDAQVNYLISEFYAPDAASGVRYDDPAFGITWPLPVTHDFGQGSGLAGFSFR